MSETIGFIGLGVMGKPMAKHLITAGHTLTVHNRSRAAVEVLARMTTGTVVIDMSSISPVATERLAKLVADKGGAMLDAPVSGGEIGAINASLSIMVGGDEAAFTRARPVFEAM